MADTMSNPYFDEGIRTVMQAVNAGAFGKGASVSSGEDSQVGGPFGEVSVHLPKDDNLAQHLRNATPEEGAALDKQMGGNQSPHMDVRQNKDGSVDLMFPGLNLTAGNKGKPWTSADIQKQGAILQEWSAGQTFKQTIGALPGAQVEQKGDSWTATFSKDSDIAKGLTAVANDPDAKTKLADLTASTGKADIGLSTGPDGSMIISATSAEINNKPGEFKTAAQNLPGTLGRLTKDHSPLSSVLPPAQPAAAPAAPPQPEKHGDLGNLSGTVLAAIKEQLTAHGISGGEEHTGPTPAQGVTNMAFLAKNQNVIC